MNRGEGVIVISDEEGNSSQTAGVGIEGVVGWRGGGARRRMSVVIPVRDEGI